MDLEQELREKLKQAREQSVTDMENEAKEEIVEDESTEEKQEDIEEDAEDEDNIDTDSKEYKELKPAEKKFAHMRKEAKERDVLINSLNERLARMEGRQEATVAPQKEEVVEIPDRDLDPDAHLDYVLAEKDKRIKTLSDKIDSVLARSDMSEAEQLYKNLEDEYSQEDTSYQDAKAYLHKVQVAELKSSHPTATNTAINKHLKDQEYILVSNLAKAGLDQNTIFNTIKGQAISKGFQETTPTIRDKTKLKKNMRKSASLNDAPEASGDVGFSPTQMAGMKPMDFHKLVGNPKEMQKAAKALKAARIKAALA